MRIKLFLTTLSILVGCDAHSANIDFRSLLTNFFTTNGYYVGLNTNAGSSLYTFTTNIAQGGGVSVAVNTNLTAVTNGSLVTLSGLGPVWTKTNDAVVLAPGVPLGETSNRISINFTNTNPANDLFNFNDQFAVVAHLNPVGSGLPWTDGGSMVFDLQLQNSDRTTNVIGDSAGIRSEAGNGTVNYGIVGGASPAHGRSGSISTTNIGVFGLASYLNFPTDPDELDAGGFFVTALDDSLLPLVGERSVIAGDNFNSGFPLLTLRTNNGSHVFQVTAAGDMAFPLTTWKSPTNGTAGQVLQTDGGAPQQLSWTTVSGGPASPQIWITNVPEGGIMWSNLNGNAKFGPALTGTFVSGYTNGGTISVGNGAGHGEGSSALGYSISGGIIHAGTDNISGGALAFGYATTDGQIQSAYRGTLAFGEAIGASSLIYSDSEGSFSGGAATAGGVIQNVGTAGLFTFGYATDSGSMIDNEAAGSLAGGHVDTGGLIKVFGGADSSFIWGRASGVGAILETKGAASFLFGEADTGAVMDNEGPGTFMFGYSEAANSIIQDFGSGDLVGGLANHGGTISGGVDVAGTISGAVGSFVFGNADSGKISDNGNGNTVGGYAAGGGKVRNGAAFGTFTWGSASQTNSFIENFANGSAVVGSVLSNSSISIGVSNPTGPQSGNGVFATAEQGGLVRMNPAVGSFISGVASGTNLLSANGTNTVTFGQNVGNSGNYAYSFGLNYTNTQDRSLNVGWSSAPSVTVWTNKIVLATDEGGSGVAERFHCSGAVVTLSTGSAVKFANISLPTNGTLGLTISVWTKASGGSTDLQSVKETFAVAAINKTGTITSSVSASTPIATITSAGTLTTAFTAVVNGNGLDLKETATTSLSAPTVICGWRMDIDSDYQPVVTQ